MYAPTAARRARPAMDSVIKALETALASSPDDVALQLNLAQAYQKNEGFESALRHFQSILVTDPAHVEALSGAAFCADKLGREKAATGYRSLMSALKGSTDTDGSPPAPATPHPSPDEAATRPER